MARSLASFRSLPFALALLAACNGSGGGGEPVLASATIGPEGGVVAVDSGVQAGLRLTIPAGALTSPVEVRVRDLRSQPLAGVLETSMAAPPGYLFGIEPTGLRLEQQATLRAPYVAAQVLETAPGNVRAREYRAGGSLDWEPDLVDVAGGFVEVPIRYLNRFQIVAGPVAPLGIVGYWQQPGTSVALSEGWGFAVEEVPESSPFAAPSALRWRISSPGVFQPNLDYLYFAFQELRGRESSGWRESWPLPYPVWTPLWQLPQPRTMVTQVNPTPSSPGTAGEIVVYADWTWAPPREIAGRLLLDLVQLRLTLAWDRADIGTGQREYRFVFAAGEGLVLLAQDGLEHVRTAW